MASFFRILLELNRKIHMTFVVLLPIFCPLFLMAGMYFSVSIAESGFFSEHPILLFYQFFAPDDAQASTHSEFNIFFTSGQEKD